MSYVKLPKGVMDYGLGFQTVNQLRDNLEFLRTTYGVEHGIEATPGPKDYLGHHNMPFIPRAVADISVVTIRPGVVYAQMSLLACHDFIGLTVQQLGAGQYQVGVANLGTFWAVCTPKSTAAATVRFIAQNPLGGALALTAYELSAGQFSPADYSFSVALYGY